MHDSTKGSRPSSCHMAGAVSEPVALSDSARATERRRATAEELLAAVLADARFYLLPRRRIVDVGEVSLEPARRCLRIAQIHRGRPEAAISEAHQRCARLQIERRLVLGHGRGHLLGVLRPREGVSRVQESARLAVAGRLACNRGLVQFLGRRRGDGRALAEELLRLRVRGIEGEHQAHFALAGLWLRALRRARLVQVLPRVALADPVRLVAHLLAVPGVVVGALLHKASRLVEVGGGERALEILIDALRARLGYGFGKIRRVLALRARLLIQLDGAEELLLAEEEGACLERCLGAHLAVFGRRARDLEEVDGGSRAGHADGEECCYRDGGARAPAPRVFVRFPRKRELLSGTAEAQLHVTELDHVARMERAHRVRVAVDADAVRASVIDDLPFVVAEEETGMLPAERRMLDDDVVLARASDTHVGPFEREFLAVHGLRQSDQPRTIGLE